MTDEKSQPKPTAKRGKIRGAGTVQSSGKASSEDRQQALKDAYDAGQGAAKAGKPTRLCPHDMGTAAHHEWHRGYHEFAHPRSTGRVEDIEDGYKKDY